MQPSRSLKEKKAALAEAEAASEAKLSERRLKQYSRRSKNGLVPISVGLSGARAGDLLRGVESASGGDTANVLLRVDTGVIKAPDVIRRSVEAEIGREQLIASVAHNFGVSHAVAELRLNDFPTVDVPNHQPLGSGCHHSVDEGCNCEPAARFTIISQGVWQQFAEEHGHGEELSSMVEERRSVCWRDVLKLMFTPGQPEGKKLILRPRLFEIVVGPACLRADDERLSAPAAKIINAVPPWCGNGVCSVSGARELAGHAALNLYDLDGHLVRLPTSAPSSFTRGEIAASVTEALRGLVPDTDFQDEAVTRCVNALQPLSIGALKSCLQKAIRFHAVSVDFALGHASSAIATPLVAAAVVGMLFASRGGFLPELQIFTRGATNALKRLAIILVEDGWVESPDGSTPHCLLALMALALATQRMSEYEPPREVVVATMRLAAQASISPVQIAWRRGSRTDRSIPLRNGALDAFEFSAQLLRIVRSFAGDMDMFDRVATLSKSGDLPISQATQQVSWMPICHIVDQHCFRGIAHIIEDGDCSFAIRFQHIFDLCTGFNPRSASVEDFESQSFVQRARFAQRCMLRFHLGCRQIALKSDGDHIEVHLNLDPGVLAAAVGPVPVKIRPRTSGHPQEVLVLLGVSYPEDEVVMLKPARATRDLFGSLNNQERTEAIAQVRTLTLPVRSPLLPDAHAASFHNGAWQVDGRDWRDIVAEGRKLKLPRVEPPIWAQDISRSKMVEVLGSDSAVENALQVIGEGIVPDAKSAIVELVSATRHSVALRALSMLHQQYTNVAMPVPSLGGNLRSDQMAAYDGDWDVYRLLVLVSRLAPGALRPSMPPNFLVPNASLLRVVELWMAQGLRAAASVVAPADGLSTPQAHQRWSTHAAWQQMPNAESSLMEHQQAAVARMHQRDRDLECGGHFLVMDTGLGKTVTSLVYAYRWLCTNGGCILKRILWVTPAGTVDNLLQQLKHTWSAPVHLVPRISVAKKPKEGERSGLYVKDFMINVIHADHLRTAIDKGLAERAPSSFIIFDEVDEMYAATLRTSAARRLCQLCPKFVAQTATPMRKNESQLRLWLADTCAFPVDSSNLLVAASGMVSIQLELGISAHEKEVRVPMTDELRMACKRLLQSPSASQWLHMAREVQAHTDEAMVKHAVQLATKDRVKHPDGGVLLVADTLEHAKKLMDMCSSQVRTGDFASLESNHAHEYAIVVVTKDKDRGYNSAVRLGALVTGAYAGNGAARHQIRGRLRRLGQIRKQVVFSTVFVENSLLHLLHQRHSAVDTMNITLEQLGQRFSAEVLKGLSGR